MGYNDRPNNQGGRTQNGYIKVSLPEGYLNGGYYLDADKKKLKKDYIINYAKSIASSLENEGGRDCNKRTQVRKFYEFLLRTDNLMKLQGSEYSFIEAMVAELVPAATYAESRKVVSAIFVSFIKKNVEQIKDEQDLRAFCKHFQSIVAFMKKDN